MNANYPGHATVDSAADSLMSYGARCMTILDLHQPDPELADRLLATCSECKYWGHLTLRRMGWLRASVIGCVANMPSKAN
jgi:hypothetical protein